jgi:hypothetical protein
MIFRGFLFQVTFTPYQKIDSNVNDAFLFMAKIQGTDSWISIQSPKNISFKDKS